MNNKFSLNRFLHNDRLVMIFSLVIAVVIWAVVVYGPSNEQERTISGVPVTVTLGDYAADTLGMRIVDGQNMTASVKVYGRRSVVEQLTAQDILLTADTTSVISPGTYSDLTVKATKNGKLTDYEIMSVDPSAASITCDIWTEKLIEVTAQINGITSADTAKYQLGTPVVSSDAMEDKSIRISGPKTELDEIAGVVAVVEDEAQLSETRVFDATLKAVDINGNTAELKNCSMNSENASVRVTVPVLFYRKVTLSYRLTNAPTAYASAQNLVTFSPSYLELWGTQPVIDSFEEQLTTLCTFDFDHLSPNNLHQKLALTVPDSLKILGGVQEITAKFNLGAVRSKNLSVQLTDSNTTFANCPAGVSVSLMEKTLSNITVCGPSNVISRIKASDLQVTVDVKGDATVGQRTLVTRVTLPNYPNVWVYYGDTAVGYDLLTTVATK